jgi:predicted phosphoribosyltransferase
MWAAVIALRQLDPARIVAAVPTAPPDVCTAFENEVDEIVAP